MKSKLILIICFSIFSTTIFSWDFAGHRVIGQIAYDQLTPQAKEKVDALTDVMFHSPYPSARFLRASTWPDQIKAQTTQYNAWHFINLPYSKDGIKPPTLNSNNVVWAIANAEKIVSDTSQTLARRAKYLSFLIHFIGDIHQPLHCTTLYSTQFPQGDRGGNLYLIHSPIAKNLHQLWDEGLGLFYSPPHLYAFKYNQVEAIAKHWMAKYPRSFFTKQLSDHSPSQWAIDSHQYAVNFAYTLPVNTAPSATYIQQGQIIVQEQSVLAGDRIADVLNKIFG
jgi:hypothetical protein